MTGVILTFFQSVIFFLIQPVKTCPKYKKVAHGQKTFKTSRKTVLDKHIIKVSDRGRQNVASMHLATLHCYFYRSCTPRILLAS